MEASASRVERDRTGGSPLGARACGPASGVPAGGSERGEVAAGRSVEDVAPREEGEGATCGVAVHTGSGVHLSGRSKTLGPPREPRGPQKGHQDVARWRTEGVRKCLWSEAGWAL